MKYFSGFSLKTEEKFFKEFLIDSEFCVAGFSYGAIEAFEYTHNMKERVDLLQLFSPANFENKDEKFKKLQIFSYQKNKNIYIKNFLQNVSYPSNIDLSNHIKNSNVKTLKKLLYYKWNKLKLQDIINRGVKVEIYLGQLDKIIDSNFCYDFFKEYGTLYYIKNVGHILQKKEFL